MTPVLGSAPNVYYAVIPWIFYPLAGAVFGAILARTPDRVAVFRWGGLLGLGLGAIGIALLVINPPTFDVETYWREPLPFVIGISGIVLVWLALCDLVTRRAWLDRRLGLFYGWSSRVIPMYFSHWILVGWGVGITGFRDLPLEAVLPAMLVAVFIAAKVSPWAVGLESTPGWLVRLFSFRSKPVAGAAPAA